MILIGSKAIKHYFPDFNREPKDTDYIVCQPMPRDKENKIEYLVNPILCNLKQEILSPDLLYTLKISHLFWDLAWDKHMFDVQFLKSKGCVLNKEIFYQLYEYWQKYHGKNKRSNLKMTAKDFFNNALKEYDHDYLHTLINPSPTYQKILKEGSEVEPDEEKYNKLSHQEKLDLVREELYVMAYERLAGRDYRVAYSWMLKKFIMNHAPMYEALFIIDNYQELRKPFINYKKQLDYELQRVAQGS
jgi:hypothetical protein